MGTAPKRRSTFLAWTRSLFRGVVYVLSFSLAFFGLVIRRESPHSSMVEPTIGVSTAHADAPLPPYYYSSCGDSSCGCGGSGSDSGGSGDGGDGG